MTGWELGTGHLETSICNNPCQRGFGSQRCLLGSSALFHQMFSGFHLLGSWWDNSSYAFAQEWDYVIGHSESCTKLHVSLLDWDIITDTTDLPELSLPWSFSRMHHYFS